MFITLIRSSSPFRTFKEVLTKNSVKMSQGNMSQDMFEDSPPKTQPTSEEVAWRGVPLNELKSTKSLLYPHIRPSHSHTVLFKLPIKAGEVLRPHPDQCQDIWDNDHVRMPHSARSLYPVSDTELKQRWLLVKQALGRPITSSVALETSIFCYNSKYSQKWTFDALHKLFSETLDSSESEYFFENVLPSIIRLALSLPSKVRGGVPLLKKHQIRSVSLTQDQVSSLLANAFLCTFPRRNSTTHYNPYPSINFNRLFQCGDLNSVQEKLKCFINYFRRVVNRKPEGIVTFSRNCINPFKLPDWSECQSYLPKLHINSEGTIDDGTGMMEIDFANKFVGGGVLGRGAVQEEIKFLICPELIISRLLTECLDDTEALIITGCERFNKYVGYADTFMWDGDFIDMTERDEFGRRCRTVVAIDATHFSDTKQQYTVQAMLRELNKAYAGFCFGSSDGWEISIATGNWGCGAFNGDPKLKALLQLMAASASKRNVAYFTFNDEPLRDSIFEMYTFLVNNKVTVGALWKVLRKYSENSSQSLSLYEFIFNQLKKEESFPMNESPPSNWAVPSGEGGQDESMITSDGELSLTESEIMQAVRCAEFFENGQPCNSSREPVSAETYSIKTEEGRKRCIETERQRWHAYENAKKEMILNEHKKSDSSHCKGLNNSSSTHKSSVKKKKITDYFQSENK